jgi:RHS repeat-associated protein
VPCEHQAVVLRVPVAGTGLALTYSSEWADGRIDRPDWNPDNLGLGGWSLDILDRYDATNKVLVAGNGSWRIVEPVAMASGELAIPSRDGRRVSVFDTAGRHQRILDARLGLQLVAFTYDDSGRLKVVAGSLNNVPMGVTIDHSVNAPIRLVSRGGAATTFQLGQDGRPAFITDPGGGETDIRWSIGGLPDFFVDPSRAVSTYTWDEAGRLTSATDADLVTLRYERTASADNITIRAITLTGRASIYRHRDVAGGRERIYIAQDGTTTTLTTDPAGNRSLSAPDGSRTTIGLQPDPRWGSAAPLLTPVVTQWPDGRQLTIDATRTVTTGADVLDVTAWKRDTTIGGSVWSETADPLARTITSIDPVGKATRWSFDAGGRVLSIVEPGAPDRTWTYDEQGRLASVSGGAAGTEATTTYAYDPSTGTLTLSRSDGRARRTGVDANGRATRLVGGDGSAILLSYDAAGRLVQVRPPGHTATTLGHSAAGRATGYVPPIPDLAAVETRTYDTDGLLAKIAGPGPRVIQLERDQSNKLAGWTFDQGRSTVTYDQLTGLPIRTDSPGGVQTDISWSGSRPIGISWSGPVEGSVSLTLDEQHRVGAESVQDVSTDFVYDRANALIGVGELRIDRDPITGVPTAAHLGTAQTTWLNDANGRTVAATTTAGNVVLLRREYERDTLGRIVTVTEVAGTASSRTQYEYDDQDRLARIIVDGNVVETDTYDAVGNRVSVVGTADTIEATYDDSDRLLEWGTSKYTYQPDGTLGLRVDRDGSWDFDFDDFGSLRKVVTNDRRQIEYLVDAAGRRVGRVVDGHLKAGYLYRPDGRIVAELDGSGALVARFGYDDGGHLALLIRGQKRYLVATDQLGGPRLVIDSETGNVAQAVEYDVWGNVTRDTNRGFTPFGFAGGLRDPDTNLVRFGARDYDPATGRWTAPDPIRFAGREANLYRYAGGDPINRADPSGLWWPQSWNPFDWPFQGDTEAMREELAAKLAEKAAAQAAMDDFLMDVTRDLLLMDERMNPQDRPIDPSPILPDTPPPPHPPWLPEQVPPEPYNPGPMYPPGDPGSGGPSAPGAGGGFSCVGPCAPPGGSACTSNCSWGEPHVVSADGLHFDFQAAGEFIAASSADESVVLQVRQETPKGITTVTMNTAIAMSVAGDPVVVHVEEDRRVVVDGVVHPEADFVFRLAHGGVVARHGWEVTVDWPGGSHLTVSPFGAGLNYVLSADPELAPTLVGILGSADGDQTNDLTGRDGARIDVSDPSLPGLYTAFAESWRISQQESLFDYLPTESTATFTRRDIPKVSDPLAGIDAATRTRAEEICRAAGVTDEQTVANCVLDVALTKDPSYAGGAAAVDKAQGGRSQPPANPGATKIDLGARTEGSVAATAKHDYTFEARKGEVIYLRAQGACVPGLSWTISDPGGRALGDQPSCVDLGRYEVTASGTWTVEIFVRGGAGGAYAFTVYAAPPRRTTTIARGDSVNDRIARIGEWHDYAVQLNQGDVFFADAKGDCVDGLFWAVIDPSGRYVGQQPSCVDLGRFEVALAGVWTVEAGSVGTAVGEYAFQLVDVPATRTTAIAVGDKVTDRIERVGEFHDYTFEVQPGDAIELVAKGDCVDGLTWNIMDAGGRILGQQPSCVGLGRFDVTAGGTWIIEVFSRGTATGRYEFVLRKGN